MTLDDFRQALDLYGSDLSQWPAAQHAEADRLLATDPAAPPALDEARQLDALIVASTGHDVGVTPEVTARAMSALLARRLPRQHGRWSHWPTVLLNLDFAPAWPRVAALACCAALGFVIGLSGLDRSIDRVGASAANRDSIGSIVFEPEPLTGARP